MNPTQTGPGPHRTMADLRADVESTFVLLDLVRAGDARALDRLFARYLVPLRRFAHGRLPPYARDLLDTNDVVQETLLHTFTRIEDFEPQRRRQRRPQPAGQHRLPHHARSGPDARGQRERMGPRRVQRRRHGDRGRLAGGPIARVESRFTAPLTRTGFASERPSVLGRPRRSGREYASGMLSERRVAPGIVAAPTVGQLQ